MTSESGYALQNPVSRRPLWVVLLFCLPSYIPGIALRLQVVPAFRGFYGNAFTGPLALLSPFTTLVAVILAVVYSVKRSTPGGLKLWIWLAVLAALVMDWTIAADFNLHPL